MDAIEAIFRRRSVRESFSPRPIPTEILETVVRCGLAAPSSKDARPWRFHVVTERAMLADLARAIATAEGKDAYVPHDPATGVPWREWSSTVDESAALLASAPAAIFIENLGRFSRSRAVLLGATPDALACSLIGYMLEMIGIGAAVQSMWIAAIAHGLSGVFMGDVLIAHEAIKQRLGTSADLVGVFVLGYGAEEKGPRAVKLDAGRVQWHPERGRS